MQPLPDPRLLCRQSSFTCSGSSSYRAEMDEGYHARSHAVAPVMASNILGVGRQDSAGKAKVACGPTSLTY